MNNNEVERFISNQEINEKKTLDDLDLSHLILIKNPNNEMAIGNYCFTKDIAWKKNYKTP
jgi:hypothetical protein